MTLKDEFEKAMFNNPEYAKKHNPEQMALALLAARWMAEYFAKTIEKDGALGISDGMIRQLAKDLDV